MPYTFFRTAMRNLAHRKGSTIIHITGLSVGITVCLAIFVIIRFENSFDSFHSKKTKIYRIISQFESPTGAFYSSGVPMPLVRSFRHDFPEVPAVAGIYGDAQTQIQLIDDSARITKKFKEASGVFFTEPSFFSIFDFTWLAGDPVSSLKDPNSAVLTQSTAERYYGNWHDAIGQRFKRNDARILTVKGIIADPPINTDFQFKIVISYPTLRSYTSDDWVTVNSNTMCYFILPDDISPERMNRMLIPFVRKYKPADRANDINIVQPLSEVHFDARAGNFLARTASRNVLQTLQLVGLFILLIACVNFINLSTAQSINRAKEVGIRKVLGSSRFQLRMQFLGEAALISCGAVILSLISVWLLLPALRTLLGIPLTFQPDLPLVLFLVLCIVVVVLLSGVYPAFVLSRFNPIRALKGKIENQASGGVTLRKGLVITQFAIAQILIIGTLVVLQQMRFFDKSPLGFDKTSVVTVPIPLDSASGTKIDYVKNQLLQLPEIRSASFSFASPAETGNWYSDFKYDHSTKNTDFGANMKLADADYLSTYSIPLVAGRAYRKSDTAGEVVVNETLVKRLGLRNPEDILNKTLDFWDGQTVFTVVGVVKDFHANTLDKPLEPVLIGTDKNQYQICNIKLTMNDVPATLQSIEKLWNQAFPSFVFEYRFLDQTIANFYRQQRQLGQLFTVFAAIAIFLSCLGLYGLASLLAAQKTREVGIRKVLGATVSQILLLFGKPFMLLVLVAFLIAAPIAYYVMQQWLQDFAYRAPLSWVVFAAGGVLTIIVSVATVSLHAARAALQNPVRSLRSE